MNATMYIIKDENAYRLGSPTEVRLWEPEFLSRTWIRRVTVSLPDGFCVAEGAYGESLIYRGNEHYELGTNKDEEPVIIDHHNNGTYIPLTVLSEGWD